MLELSDGAIIDPVQELSDALDTGVVIVDEQLTIRHWNRWMEAASERRSEDVVGRALLDIFPELRGDRRESALRRALAGESLVLAHHFHEYFLPLAARDYPQYPHMQQSTRLMPVLRRGQPAGAILLLQDVTERVAREEQLRAAMASAEAASEAKSAFIASTSHELRTPLSAILGYSDLMAGEIAGPLTPRQKDFLGRIKLSTLHLMSLIEEILTFSRIEAGKEELLLEPCDLAGLAREAVMLVEPQALRKGLSLTCTAPDELPVTSDSRKVRQVLLNLLGNAVKFTDSGSVALEVVEDGDRACYRVRDTGPGIAPHQMESIFEAFTQGDQTMTRLKGGTGLGLAVSRKLAEMLGGTLTVESALGQGSTFTVWLPKETPEAGA